MLTAQSFCPEMPHALELICTPIRRVFPCYYEFPKRFASARFTLMIVAFTVGSQNQAC
jgi:hypothetical protein